MPHFRATIKGLSAQSVDEVMREAKIGAVVGTEVDKGTQASGTPGATPELQSVQVTVQADDADEARSRLEEALPAEASIDVAG